MKYTQDDIDWIERFYGDIEAGYLSIGKTYKRPADYIERAMRIIKGSRNPLKAQFEGKRRYYHEDN